MNKKLLLIDPHVVVNELDKKFDPQFHYIRNNRVRYWLGDSFHKHVLDPAKIIDHLPEISSSKYKFTETIYDMEIMENFSISKSSGLMEREEILWMGANLTLKQPMGEKKGILITDGSWTILGYMICDDGLVRIVSMRWVSNPVRGNVWRFSCNDKGYWDAGFEMLYHN